MKMIKTQLWLAALIALAVLVVVTVEWSGQPASDLGTRAAEAPKAPWLGDQPLVGRITGFAVQHPGGSGPWQLERVQRRWIETAPSRFPVDSPAIDALLDSLLESQVVMTPQQLREAGRLPASAEWDQAVSLVFFTEDQQQIQTHWLPAGVGGWAYCLNVASDQIWLLEGRLLSLMEEPNPAAWRIRRVGQLGQPGAAALDGVQFERPGDPQLGRPAVDLDLRRRLDGWRIGESEDAVDREELEQLITRLHAIQLMAFVRDAADEQTRTTIGLGQEAGRITWRWTEVIAPAERSTQTQTPASPSANDGQAASTPVPSTLAAAQPQTSGPARQSLTIRFGPTLDTPGGAWMVAAASFGQDWSPPFLVPAQPIEQLFNVAESARDARFIAERWTQITAISIEDQGRLAGEWARTDQGWQTRFPQQWGPPEIGPFMQLMRTIGEGRAQAFVPRPDRDPQRTINLGLPGRSRPLRLHLVAIEEPEHPHVGRWMIYRQGESFGRLIAPADQDILTADPITFRSLAIQLQPETWQALRLEQPHSFAESSAAPNSTSGSLQPGDLAETTHHTFHLKPIREDASSVDPSSADHHELDPRAVDNLLSTLRPLRIRRWLDTAPSRQPANLVRLTWTERDGSSQTLAVDPATGHATLTGLDTPFEVSQALREALTAEFRNRIAMPLTQATIRRVRLYEQDQLVTEISIARRSIQVEAGRQLPEALIRRLLDAAAPLEVLRWMPPENLHADRPRPPGETDASGLADDLKPVRRLQFDSLDGQEHVIEVLGRPGWIRTGGKFGILRPEDDRRLREPWTE